MTLDQLLRSRPRDLLKISLRSYLHEYSDNRVSEPVLRVQGNGAHTSRKSSLERL